FMQALQTPYSF
nr:immunoglobulin light chain junction region [Macaca mulatta]